MEKDFNLVKDFPLQMLNMALNEVLEDVRGMRPPEEIAQLIDRTDEIKTNNPSDDYIPMGKLGSGGQAEVIKVRKKKQEDTIYAMKKVVNVEDYEVKKVIEEASLLTYLGCNEIVKCTDLYYHKKVVYIFLEFMDQGPLTKIIENYYHQYSEEFCKYSLYKAALGL